MIELNNEDFNELIKEGTVLVDFYADWCGPCKMMNPIINQLAQEQPNLKIIKVNVDFHDDLARSYQVMSIPTIIIFKEGTEKERIIGFVSKDKLTELINK